MAYDKTFTPFSLHDAFPISFFSSKQHFGFPIWLPMKRVEIITSFFWFLFIVSIKKKHHDCSMNGLARFSERHIYLYNHLVQLYLNPLFPSEDWHLQLNMGYIQLMMQACQQVGRYPLDNPYILPFYLLSVQLYIFLQSNFYLK